MPDAYPSIVRHVIVVRTIAVYPSNPRVEDMGFVYRPVTPPSDVPQISTLTILTQGSSNMAPKPSMEYSIPTSPDPTTPDLLGSMSMSVGVRRSP